MREQTKDGRPEFPADCSLRAYAAIKLRVPESGLDWLDAMIERANRDALAGQALAGILVRRYYNHDSGDCYKIADAMQAAARAKGQP